MARTAEQITAELNEARALVEALEAELAAVEVGHGEAETQAASALIAEAETMVFRAARSGGTARHFGADKGMVTRRFNEAMKVWGGDYDALRKYTLDKVMGDANKKDAANYLLRTHFSR